MRSTMSLGRRAVSFLKHWARASSEPRMTREACVIFPRSTKSVSRCWTRWHLFCTVNQPKYFGKNDMFIYFYLSAHATLEETFTTKYNGVLPLHLYYILFYCYILYTMYYMFTPLSETTSISPPFHMRVPLPHFPGVRQSFSLTYACR